MRLRIPGITDDNADIKHLVKAALSSDNVHDWLMIVDNADDPGVLIGGAGGDLGSARLHDYLPYSNKGKIVFTTRSRKAAGDLTQGSVLELNDMSQAEARQLLTLRISKPALLDDGRAVNKLLESLTYLPLAIVQAAAFINNNDISVSEYISLFDKTGTKTELFGEYFEDPSRYRGMESTIAKTWHISFDQIRRQDPLAAEYLSFIACIDRINIPQSLLPPGGSLLQRTKAIGTLKGYAFVTERQQALQELESDKFFDMHRLVHMASVWWLDGHGEQTAWTTKAAARLEELIPYGELERKKVWTTYLSHAIYVAGPESTLANTVRASVLDRVGRCQASLGQYSVAETTHRQVLSLREKSLGKEHDYTLVSMNEVGVALINQGRYKEAESMHRQTLALQEKVHGLEHLDPLRSMNNLATALRRQGKYKEAESMQRQTLAIFERVLGSEHPDTLTSINNLAHALSRQGKYEEAESMQRQELAICERVLGPEHPDTLVSVYNLAHLLANRHCYSESIVLYERACTGYSAVLGEDHPTTLRCRKNYSKIVMSQGEGRLPFL